MKKVIRSTRLVETPMVSASARFWTVARIRRPKDVNFSSAARPARQASASTTVNS